jgi:bidirectional [NiFe] hydrogenase diaphorase subunit
MIHRPDTNSEVDVRYTAVDRTMKRFNFRKEALLEVLNTAQESFGYLSQDLLTHIAQGLNVPLAKVYGVATFYQLFSFEPLGKHNCIICTGTACHVKGSGRIVEVLSEHFDVPEGETTADGLFSLSTARCVGSCGIAPVVVLDDDVRGKESPETMEKYVRDLLDGERLSGQEA